MPVSVSCHPVKPRVLGCMSNQYLYIVYYSLISAGFFSALVLIKSILHFSRTGPQIKDEIQQHYYRYTVYALARLYFWCTIICFVLALPGVALLCLYFKTIPPIPVLAAQIAGLTAGLCSIGLVTARQFLHYLFYNPGLIVTSVNFNPQRLNPIFDRLSKFRLHLLDAFLLVAYCWAYSYVLKGFAAQGSVLETLSFTLIPVIYLAGGVWASLNSRQADNAQRQQADTKPHTKQQSNILMIGSDTLRADHLSINGYKRNTTPFIDTLATKGTYFKNCFVPIARTAPSLASIFTANWPDRHKIKTNYSSQEQAKAMNQASLGSILAKNGYQTSVISDWAGSDFGKFDFGFSRKNVPQDQWNLKYLIRQGPKDIRLLLSLFCHNKIGKRILPELYYLAGVPLSEQLGRDARQEINTLASEGQPFFLNVFMGTTHPPFSSNYPYYEKYTDSQYTGKSRFCMSRLTTPEEVIESQQEPREAFDLDQVIALYDGSIRQFDSEVEKIVKHLEQSGLSDNTIVVIYSDHGIDLFEHDTWGQGNSIASDASAKTPLIIYAPRIGEASVVQNKVRSIDIMPTLLELTGLSAPGNVDGVSLASAIYGKGVPNDLPVIFETGLWLAPPPKQKKNHLTYPDIFHLMEVPDKKAGTLALKDEYLETIENARDWFVWVDCWLLKCYQLNSGPQYELFNTNDDPEYGINLALKHPNIVREMISVKACSRS